MNAAEFYPTEESFSINLCISFAQCHSDHVHGNSGFQEKHVSLKFKGPWVS